MNSYDVSVVVPVYNVEKYLKNCIDTILGQSFCNFELLIIDDGSTDLSGKICDEYAAIDNRIKVVHKENAGVSSARNMGLNLATGKYITFVDSDDWVDEDFLETAVSICEKKRLDIFMGGIARIDNNGERFRFGTIDDAIFSRDILFENEYVELLENCYTSSCCSNVYRRDFIADVRFKEGAVWGEDLCFVHKLLKKKPAVFASSHIYYNYRLTDGSATTKISRKKTVCVRKTYLTLLEFGKFLKFEEDGCYMEYIKKRIREDYFILYQMILHSKNSPLDKFILLHELLSDKRIRVTIRQQKADPYFKRIGYNPVLILLYFFMKKKFETKR